MVSKGRRVIAQPQRDREVVSKGHRVIAQPQRDREVVSKGRRVIAQPQRDREVVSNLKIRVRLGFRPEVLVKEFLFRSVVGLLAFAIAILARVEASRQL